MKRIEDIKKFDDIDTYYEISSMVEEIFEDRVEAHKHLVTANEEIERLHSIIKEVREYIKLHIRKDEEYPDYMEMLKYEYKELLEILDKVEENK